LFYITTPQHNNMNRRPLILYTFFHLSMKLHIHISPQSFFFGICTLSSSSINFYMAQTRAHTFQEMLNWLLGQKHTVMSSSPVHSI